MSVIDIRTASREEFQLAVALHRRKIERLCRQLKLDVDSFNENRLEGVNPIIVVWDFTHDLQEWEAGADYPKVKP